MRGEMNNLFSSQFDIKSHILKESKQWLLNTIKEPVSNVVDFCKFVTHIFRGDNWVFRGESHLFDKPLAPSIIRDELDFTRRRHPGKSITDQEIEEIEKCQLQTVKGLIKDRYLRAFLPAMHLEDVNWLPLAQHFGFKTRLFRCYCKSPCGSLFCLRNTTQ